MDLDELKEHVASLDLPLKDQATQLVFGKGNPNAEIFSAAKPQYF